MADMITRCPKCGTAFRISDALLKSAKGVVRCGSCLSVFNAREHLEPGKSAVAAPTTKESRPTQESRGPQESSIARESRVPQEPRPANPPPQRQTPPPAPTPPPAEEPKPAAKSSPFLEMDEDDVDMPEWRRRSSQDEPYSADSFQEQEPDEDEDDEAWALELLKDDDDLNVQFKKVTPKAPAEKPAREVESHFASEASPPTPPAEEIHNTFAEIDEQLAPLEPEQTAEASSESEDTEAELEADTVDAPASHHTESVNAPLAAKTFQSEPPAEAEDEPEAPPEPPKRKPIRPKLEPKSTPLKDVIASLEPEPLEVDWQEPGAWRRRLLWPLLALVALVCLLAQVAWLEFDRLSRVEPYRSAYGIVCNVVGCELPELLDRSQIQTSNLLVRSHPEVADALQVDVILQNNAPFEQTFPVLELTFTDLRSEPVATRRLDPADYLGGELAGRDKMPVRQPIHIALEIADPGSEAVSYHITIVD